MHGMNLVFLCFLILYLISIYGYSVKGSGDRSHICCDVEIKDFYLNFTHEEYKNVNTTVVRTVLTGELRRCHVGEPAFTYNIFLMPMCQVSKKVEITVEELVPRNVTELIPQKGSCPPEHIRCCDGYTKVGDQCVDSNTANSPELQQLIDAGLVG